MSAVKTDDRGYLRCPSCGSEFTHVDDAVMLSREGEGAPRTWTRVNSGGVVTREQPGYPEIIHAADMDTLAPSARSNRHAILLVGACEDGCRFVLEFRQHKGVTITEARRIETVTVELGGAR